jgi:DNA ligase-1
MQPSSYKTRKGRRICDPEGWFLAEKLDGMKGRWIDGCLQTRSGKALEAPQWFLDLLPDQDIEGELYFGKNTFEKTGGLRSNLRRTSSSSWEKVTFHVFDIVNYKWRWRKRQRKLREMGEAWTGNHPFRVVQWEEVKSSADVERRFKALVKTGAEGVIIADPRGKYEDGRVEQILKYKKIQDCEAVIIGYNTDDSGDRLASFKVHPITKGKINRKITFNIGTGLKMTQRYRFKRRFPIGATVTYTYELMGKNGKPRTPVFKGVRVDL